MKEKTEFSTLLEKTGLTKEEAAEKMGYTIRTIYRWEQGDTQPRKNVMDWLVYQSENKNRSLPVLNEKFRFIDLFAGIGGLRRGFESIGGKCVYTSEWNEYSKQTYLANFVCDHEIDGDITKVPVENIPFHDVLVAGFPCQPFSIAGVSKKNSLGVAHGFRCEAQGTLFFDVARIIEHHKPKTFLLENVKNLVSHNKGNTFKVIRDTLEKELGYNISWKVINGKGFVPQNRERIFIVGFREDVDVDFDFENIVIPNPLEGPKIGTILHPENGSETEEKRFTEGDKATVLNKYTLSDKLWSFLQGYSAKHKAKGNGFGFGMVEKNDVARTLSARYYKDGSEILVKQEGKNPRRLTPRECARLMGFDSPDGSNFIIPVSDTQAYKQFGNSVVVPVVKTVAQYMQPYIIESISLEKDKDLLKYG
ncbi:DNA (cytosine-5-)-methyltransferase [Methylococcaceae bacterium CS1]|nr:DNA (cytosine-5-)-methyltransferase [Methylococcaceae bacterium CS4]TXK94231.1 DNA (cytosine-5-)-methyltransferase [Methylococcaceae bacterium CS5]TXL03893.1 DNA (cytosine-5-)-methyltransferase [Methylococcaceae bacterium CS1]TXL04300.1 DNA (cytosine-5-)-methyltransferase [Methylococcaceae bacterium CS3]TXL08205.1 DNA (cytosine-5-)-methyltransferase [Methylococcaceae bacterium CS2]